MLQVSRRSRSLGALAIVCLALGAATVMQENGANQTSHYALVRSLSVGTPIIDRYHAWTIDKARFQGHWYSSRAPGLALVSLPPYEVLSLVNAPGQKAASIPVQQGVSTSESRFSPAVWPLTLWAALLPAVSVLVLTRYLGDRLQPGYGPSAAIALGAGTLLLPFSTLLFSHVLSAAFGLAAFALLWRERDGPSNVFLVGVAGVMVGVGITTEYPLAIVGLILGLYAISRPLCLAAVPGKARLLAAVRRGLVYSLGVILGLLPLLAYNQRAFGSPTHVAYNQLQDHRTGFFGINVPDPRVAVDLLLSTRGLLTLAPVLFLALPGLVLLYRRGRRAEAAVIAGVALVFLLYNAGYWLPFGGRVPGPRFLIPALPFLGVPLALAFWRLPGPAIALTVASAVALGAATLTEPMVGEAAHTAMWASALLRGEIQDTFLSVTGVASGVAAALPFVGGVGGALVVAAAAARSKSGTALSARQYAVGAVAVLGWAAYAILGPSLLGIDPDTGRPLPLLELVLLALVIALGGLGAATTPTLLRGFRPRAQAPPRHDTAP